LNAAVAPAELDSGAPSEPPTACTCRERPLARERVSRFSIAAAALWGALGIVASKPGSEKSIDPA